MILGKSKTVNNRHPLDRQSKLPTQPQHFSCASDPRVFCKSKTWRIASKLFRHFIISLRLHLLCASIRVPIQIICVHNHYIYNSYSYLSCRNITITSNINKLRVCTYLLHNHVYRRLSTL